MTDGDPGPDRSPGRSVGRSVPRKDAGPKVRGTVRYGTDVEREDALQAGVLRSQHPHARITSIDTDGAANVEGVAAAITRMDLPAGFDNRVRHYGDVIASVAGETESAVEAGLDAVEYDLEPLASVHDPKESLRDGPPVVHEDGAFGQPDRHPRSVENPEYVQNVDDYHRLELGDVEAGFDDADHVHAATYRTPRTNHCNLDRHCCFAEWDGDTLTITGTLGNRGHAEETLERLFGDCEVEIRQPPVSGSSFGGRSLAKLLLEPVAATLARETGQPVRLAFDREAEFTATDSRHAAVIDVRAGATDDGDLTTLAVDLVADTGPYPNGVGHVVLTGALSRPIDRYSVENYRFEGVSAFTNNLPAGEYRGIGVTQVAWAVESHLDELARRSGFDPVDFRRENWVEDGEKRPHRDGPVPGAGQRECLEEGREPFAELCSDGGDGEPGDPDSEGSVVRGRGVAAGGQMITPAEGKNTDYAEVRLVLSPDGSLAARTGAIDVGQGATTALAQIAAETTGVDVERVTVQGYDPDAGINDKYGSIANRTTYLIGAAVEKAAGELTRRLRSRAESSLPVRADELRVESGSVRSPDGSAVDLASLLDEPLSATGQVDTDTAPLAFGVHFAEVAVDTETGETNVTAYVAAQDVGYAINPALVEGQLEGAVQHGIEFATLSEVQLSRGVPENANLADYPVSSPAEMPDRMACEIVETNEESGPFGAKGVGTPAMPPVAPAIANAIRDATGVRFTDAPIRDEDVFFALQEGDG